MAPIISIQDLTKTYKGGFTALKNVSLDIAEGEILALLGPNGAGKTTLISIVCGLVNPTSGAVTVGGHDIITDYRAARELIGLVPQELKTEAFETVWSTVTFSRGLFGKPPNPGFVTKILDDLSLTDKRDNMMMQLSGGMKRRVMIAKALSHEPKILFLDEPSAGVDVELRKGMWAVVERLRESGVTIILTTHYIEEAEEIADRVAIIDKGQIVVVDEKAALMRRMGKKHLSVALAEPISAPPPAMAGFDMELSEDGRTLTYIYDRLSAPDGVASFMRALARGGAALQRPRHRAEQPRRNFCRSGAGAAVNYYSIRAIYIYEMARTRRTLMGSVLSPVISTTLYFVVFGSAIGSRIDTVQGVDYGAFLVPGLMMFTLLTQSVSNASFGIYFPRFVGTIYELLSAPVSPYEALIGYVGAAATKSLIISFIILATAGFFVPLEIQNPALMLLFLVLTAVTFCLLGFIIGIWAENFEQLQLVPLLIITPLVFLGGTFYSIDMLPEPWRTITLFNPVLYLVSGFRTSFYGTGDVSLLASFAMIFVFLIVCVVVVWRIFETGYKLKQ